MIASFTNIELGTLYLIPYDQAELSDGWNTRIPPSASSKHVSVYIFKVSKHKTNQTFLFAPTTKQRHIPDLALARAANDPSVLTVTKEVPTRAANGRFQPWEGPLRDCENQWIICSSIWVLLRRHQFLLLFCLDAGDLNFSTQSPNCNKARLLQPNCSELTNDSELFVFVGEYWLVVSRHPHFLSRVFAVWNNDIMNRLFLLLSCEYLKNFPLRLYSYAKYA